MGSFEDCVAVCAVIVGGTSFGVLVILPFPRGKLTLSSSYELAILVE